MRQSLRPQRLFHSDLPSPVGPDPLDVLITPDRARLFRQILARRTGRLTVVIEDCHDPHNATAIVRTADAFGLDAIHVTTARNAFRLNPRICQGSQYYVGLEVHASIVEAYAALRSAGFRIMVSDLAAAATIGPERLAGDLDRQPLALVFGSEGEGVSPAAAQGADGVFLIPMVGFPQSLNVSVSVAVSLYALRQAALVGDLAGDLPPAVQVQRYRSWIGQQKGEAAQAILGRGTGRDGEELEIHRA